MKDLPPPHDLVEAMGESYELLLEKAIEKSRQGARTIHHAIDEIRDEMVVIDKSTDKRSDRIAGYLKRDLVDAAGWLNKTGDELKNWLGFDATLLKQQFWDRFSEAADQTTLALTELKLKSEVAEYHSGEIIGLGTLVCDQCGEKLHFHKPGRIPPCPRCQGSHFHREHIT